MSSKIIEVAETLRAGWAWRCHVCDITHANLQEPDAKERARRHELDSLHVWNVRRLESS